MIIFPNSKGLRLCGLVLLLAGCGLAFKDLGASEKGVLPLSDVQGLIVRWRPSRGTLTISGLAFHSALAVERMTTEREGKRLLVRVLLAPARRGLSGSFDYPVRVPPAVMEVAFGDNGHVVWHRPKR